MFELVVLALIMSYHETGNLYFSYHVFQMLRDKMCLSIGFYEIYGIFFF